MYRIVLSFLNPILFVLALLFQPLLIYTIIRHSPSNLKSLKAVLLNTSCFQLLHATTAFLTQFRQVSNLSPIQIWSYGTIRHLEAHYCYIVYHILQTSAMVSSLSAFFTIYMKYHASRYVVSNNTPINIVKILLGSIILASVTCEVILIFIQSLPAEIREQYKLINQNTTEHSHIGIVDSSVAPSLINMVIINGLVFMLPVLAYFLRRKVIAIIAPSIDGVSAAKGSQSRTFLNGLTIQVLMPFLLYVPVFFCQQFTFFTKIELLFQQYFIFVCPAMPTVVDPLISLYFVKPYRKQIKIWLNMERKEIPINQSPSVFIVV